MVEHPDNTVLLLLSKTVCFQMASKIFISPKLASRSKFDPLHLLDFQFYVEWSSHETESGVYTFEGNADIEEYLKVPII